MLVPRCALSPQIHRVWLPIHQEDNSWGSSSPGVGLAQARRPGLGEGCRLDSRGQLLFCSIATQDVVWGPGDQDHQHPLGNLLEF